MVIQDPAVAAVIQMNSGADRDANLAAAAALLERAATGGARLAVLPENFALMGQHETDKLQLAEDDGAGVIQDFLAETARRLDLWIVGGTIPIRAGGDATRVRAACGVWDASGRRVARYDKIHLFDVDVPDARGERYRESATIEPGEPRAVVVDTPCGRVGLSVCYDLRFPELYRALAAAGAQILCVPSAFTERTGRAHWDTLLRARAVENLCHVLAANQCGAHPGNRRTWGHSCIVEPWGRIVAACEDVPEVAVAVLETDAREALRRGFPVLAHRRLGADATH